MSERHRLALLGVVMLLFLGAVSLTYYYLGAALTSPTP